MDAGLDRVEQCQRLPRLIRRQVQFALQQVQRIDDDGLARRRAGVDGTLQHRVVEAQAFGVIQRGGLQVARPARRFARRQVLLHQLRIVQREVGLTGAGQHLRQRQQHLEARPRIGQPWQFARQLVGEPVGLQVTPGQAQRGHQQGVGPGHLTWVTGMRHHITQQALRLRIIALVHGFPRVEAAQLPALPDIQLRGWQPELRQQLLELRVVGGAQALGARQQDGAVGRGRRGSGRCGRRSAAGRRVQGANGQQQALR